MELSDELLEASRPDETDADAGAEGPEVEVEDEGTLREEALGSGADNRADVPVLGVDDLPWAAGLLEVA